MDTNKADVASKSTGNDEAITAKADDDDDANNSKSSSGATSASVDFLIFGARPSHLFDDIAITIDSLLTEEVANLPLLPRKLTEQELRQQQQQQQEGEGQRSMKPQTGEEKLIAKLRKAYKKNLDLAEAYCSRNIFTLQYFSKTKRRKILENYLAQDNSEVIDK